jgi:hypothetical protein
MFNRIRTFFLRAAAESAIDRAERENAATAETDPWTPSLDDRRRLAVAEVFLIAERQDGMVHPAEYGQVILRNVVDQSEVATLADTTTQTVNRRIQRGQLG